MASGSIVAFNIDFNRWHYEHQNRYWWEIPSKRFATLKDQPVTTLGNRRLKEHRRGHVNGRTSAWQRIWHSYIWSSNLSGKLFFVFFPQLLNNLDILLVFTSYMKNKGLQLTQAELKKKNGLQIRLNVFHSTSVKSICSINF